MDSANFCVRLSNIHVVILTSVISHYLVQTSFGKVTSSNMPSLEELDNNYNKLPALSSEPILDNTMLLEDINTESNAKSSSRLVFKVSGFSIQGILERDTFSDLPFLEELDISHNRLKGVNPYSLSSLKNLKLLNLSYNNIEELQEYAFVELNSLKSLDLKNNSIYVIRRTSFLNLTSLNYLDLSGNKLKDISCDFTVDFHRLEQIYLQDNQIKSFTAGTFFYSPHLKVMDVTGNNLECSCELSHTVQYLILNSAMKMEDLTYVSCILPYTLESMSVTDYDISKCTPIQPCKYITPVSSSSHFKNTRVSSVASTEYNVDHKIPEGTEALNLVADSDIEIVKNFSYDGRMLCVKWTVAGTLPPKSRCIIKYTFIKGTKLENIKCPSSSNEFQLWSMPGKIYRFCISILYGSTKISSCSFTSKKTSVTLRTIGAVDSDEHKFQTINVSTVTIPVTNEDVSKCILIDSCQKILAHSYIADTENNSVFPLSPKEYRANPVAFNGSETILSANPDITIMKNFSYDGKMLCVKWTVVGKLPTGSRCIIKYTFVKGTKLENLKCPSSSNEFQLWSRLEKIYRFCIVIYAGRKIRSCNFTSKNISINFRTISHKKSDEYDDNSSSAPTGIIPVTSHDISKCMLIDSCKKISEYSGDIESTSVSTGTPKDYSADIIMYKDTEATTDPAIVILKNFSYDGRMLCVKWTVTATLPPTSRCIIKYTFIKGTKLENLKCPSSPNEFQLWSRPGEIYRFCIVIYARRKISSCNFTSNKINTAFQTISHNNYEEYKGDNSTASTTTISVTKYDVSKCILIDSCKKISTESYSGDIENFSVSTVTLYSTDAITYEDTERTTVAALSDITIVKNFSYDGKMLCVKWTFTGTLPPKSRCVVKYTFIKGTKLENIKCPSSSNEFQLWSKPGKIYRFCISIYAGTKISSCNFISKEISKAFRAASYNEFDEFKEDRYNASTTVPLTNEDILKCTLIDSCKKVSAYSYVADAENTDVFTLAPTEQIP